MKIPRLADAKAFSDYINKLVEEDTFISSRKQTVEDEERYIKSMLKNISDNKEVHIVAFEEERKIGSVDIFSLGVRKEHAGELQINILNSFRGQGFQQSGLLPKAIKYKDRYIDEIQMYKKI